MKSQCACETTLFDSFADQKKSPRAYVGFSNKNKGNREQ